jgi:hypothetical protein
MNSRQRFLETMRLGRPDRAPLFDEGIRDSVLKLWRAQGVLPGYGLGDLFHFDRREEIALNLRTRLDLPALARRKDGLKEFQRYLEANHDVCMPEGWIEHIPRWKTREHVLMLMVHWGFFQTMGVGDWETFADGIYLLADYPEFVRAAMEIHGEFAARLTDRFLQDVQIDAALFSEPIGGDHGALISPQTYREFVLASYRPILDVLSKYGVDIVIWRTYANTRVLLPVALEAGINCLWACECNPQAMDYLDLRNEYGGNLGLIAGIDLDVLRQNQQAICLELETKVASLLEQGGYIPLADGRVREDIPFENYAYYRRLLEKIVTGKVA